DAGASKRTGRDAPRPETGRPALPRSLRPGGRQPLGLDSGRRADRARSHAPAWGRRTGDPGARPRAAAPAAGLTERGHMPRPGAGAPGILALGDRGRLRQLVVEAGFSDPTIDEV